MNLVAKRGRRLSWQGRRSGSRHQTSLRHLSGFIVFNKNWFLLDGGRPKVYNKTCGFPAWGVDSHVSGPTHKPEYWRTERRRVQERWSTFRWRGTPPAGPVERAPASLSPPTQL